jgi:hypothetical protein
VAQTVLEETGNLKVAQELPGHGQISTTADQYMHVDHSAMVSAVEAVKFSLDGESATPSVDHAPSEPQFPVRYAFSYDAVTIEELDKASGPAPFSTDKSS